MTLFYPKWTCDLEIHSEGQAWILRPPLLISPVQIQFLKTRVSPHSSCFPLWGCREIAENSPKRDKVAHWPSKWSTWRRIGWEGKRGDLSGSKYTLVNHGNISGPLLSTEHSSRGHGLCMSGHPLHRAPQDPPGLPTNISSQPKVLGTHSLHRGHSYTKLLLQEWER